VGEVVLEFVDVEKFPVLLTEFVQVVD